MAYCTEQDVENAAGGARALRELSDWDAAQATDSTLIAAKISEAERWIDSYARLHYSVPFTDGSVPDEIVTLCAREVCYRLSQPRGMALRYQAQHDEDLEWLRDLSRGKVRITIAPPSQSPAAESGQTSAAAGDVPALDLEGFL